MVDKNCLNCGTIVSESDKFCGRCGKNIDIEDPIFTLNIEYLGGHIEHNTKKGVGGTLELHESKLTFISNNFQFQIPLEKIARGEIGIKSVEDINHQAQMSAAAFFAGYGPMSTFKRSINVLSIPYFDEAGIKQQPLFKVNNEKKTNELLSRLKSILIEKNTPEVTNKITSNEDPLTILKQRFAKGEISKEEFMEMKELLE
jgi:hypothetical protein